jgi:hypothetical protein
MLHFSPAMRIAVLPFNETPRISPRDPAPSISDKIDRAAEKTGAKTADAEINMKFPEFEKTEVRSNVWMRSARLR